MLQYMNRAGSTPKFRPTVGRRRTGQLVQGANAGRNLPRYTPPGRGGVYGGGGGYRPGGINIPDLPYGYGDAYGGGGMPFSSGIGGSNGFPIGSVNLRPSKWSGGFRGGIGAIAIDTQNRRTGSMREIDARRSAQQNAGMLANQSASNVALNGGWQPGQSGGGVGPTSWSPNIPDLPGGPGGGLGGDGQIDPNTDLGQFLGSADAGQAAARAANEQRYADILAAYNAREKHAVDGLTGLGASQSQAIDDRHKQAGASSAQDLASRGLGNTTVRASVMKGHDAEASRQKAALQESLMRERLTMLNALQSEKLGFMERRNDVGPDLNGIANLAGGLGESGANPMLLAQKRAAARGGFRPRYLTGGQRPARAFV